MSATFHNGTHTKPAGRTLRYLLGTALTATVLLLAEPMVSPGVPLAGGQATAQIILNIPHLKYRGGYRGGSRSGSKSRRGKSSSSKEKEKDQPESSSSSDSRASR